MAKALQPGAPTDSLYFDPETMELDVPSKQRLQDHAGRLKANPRQVIILAAFTEDLGSRSYNLAVAERELQTVVAHLRALGVAKKQIRRRPHRLTGMPANCTAPICRQKARHVTLTYQ